MIDDFKKSVNSILYERTTSPLFGAFFFSWIIWNWKIILVLFFTESSELGMTKFEYIDTCLLSIWSSLINPIISTILILTVYSWLSEKAYMLWLYFNKRKNDHKNKIEKEKLLTVEQSMKLRIELSNKEESFENLINDKEELISALKKEIEGYKNLNTITDFTKNLDKKDKSTEQDNTSIYIEKLKEKKFDKKFLDFSLQILRSNQWYDHRDTPEEILYFFKIGLIQIHSKNTTETSLKYSLTTEGNLVFNKLRIELN